MKNVVYSIRGPCGLDYVGCTTQALHIHLGEHITNTCKGFPDHSVSKHYAEKHNKNPRGTTFIALETYY